MGLALQRNEIDANEKIKNEHSRTKTENQYDELTQRYETDKREWNQRISQNRLELETSKQHLQLAEQNISLLQKGMVDFFKYTIIQMYSLNFKP